MHFRTKNIADSVTDRITAIAENIRTGAPLPASRGAAVVKLNRADNGDLMVTKTFENGETELLTISNTASGAPLPEGFVDVTPGDAAQPAPAELSPGADSGNIVQNAALGGDSLDALLRN